MRSGYYLVIAFKVICGIVSQAVAEIRVFKHIVTIWSPTDLKLYSVRINRAVAGVRKELHGHRACLRSERYNAS
ncbi:unknown [Clostridium sp. CAG:138]|nr:unknown [Clostridium sp. CAG:138]